MTEIRLRFYGNSCSQTILLHVFVISVTTYTGETHYPNKVKDKDSAPVFLLWIPSH